jgi:hypothetical protein
MTPDRESGNRHAANAGLGQAQGIGLQHRQMPKVH